MVETPPSEFVKKNKNLERISMLVDFRTEEELDHMIKALSGQEVYYDLGNHNCEYQAFQLVTGRTNLDLQTNSFKRFGGRIASHFIGGLF